MSKIIVGQPGMHQQPSRGRYVQGKGWTWFTRWEGPQESAAGLVQQLITAGYDVDFQETGPNCIVEATIGTRDDVSPNVETPTNVWEVAVNRTDKSLYEFTKVVALGNTKVQTLRDVLDGKEEASSLDSSGDQLTAYNHMIRGVEAFIVEQSVVRHTQIVSGRYARAISKANVGKIFTPAQMISIAGVPTNTDGTSPVLETAETPPTTTSLGFTTIWGYRKAKPTMNQLAGNQWQIVTEYESGFWSLWIFTQAS